MMQRTLILSLAILVAHALVVVADATKPKARLVTTGEDKGQRDRRFKVPLRKDGMPDLRYRQNEGIRYRSAATAGKAMRKRYGQNADIASIGGFSGQGNRDDAAAKKAATDIAQSLLGEQKGRRKRVLVGGGTPDGIGAIGNQVAKDIGAVPAAVVSSQALGYAKAGEKVIDPAVGRNDRFIISDKSWGGAGSETSKAFVGQSNRGVGYVGGGLVAADEMKMAQANGQRVIFQVSSAGSDANPDKVNAKRAKKGLEPTNDFRGEAELALAEQGVLDKARRLETGPQ